MANAAVPEREVICPFGHAFLTRARPGNKTHCRARLTAAEAAERGKSEGDRCAALTGRMPMSPRAAPAAAPGSAPADARTAVWDGAARWRPPRPADLPGAVTAGVPETHAECGGPLRRTPRGTMRVCVPCDLAAVPSRVVERAAGREAQALADAAASRATPAAELAELRRELDRDVKRAEWVTSMSQWAAALEAPDGLAAELARQAPEVARDAAGLAARFRSLAGRFGQTDTPAELNMHAVMARETMAAARPVLPKLRAELAELRAALAAPERAAIDASGDDDDGPAEMDAAELTAVQIKWAAVLGGLAERFPDPAGVPALYAQLVIDRVVALRDAQAEIDAAENGAELADAAERAADVMASAKDALGAVWSFRRAAVMAAPVRAPLPGPRAPLALPRGPSGAPSRPDLAAIVSVQRRARQACAAEYGTCEITRNHRVRRALGNPVPPAEYMRVIIGGNGSHPSVRICAAAKCDLAAAAALSARGYPDAAQRKERLS